MKDRPSIRSEHVTMPLTPEELLSRGKAKNGQSLPPSTSASEFPSSRLAHTLYSGGRSEKKIWKQEKNVSMRGGQGVLIWGDARPKSLSYCIAELERTIITGHLQQTVLQGTIPAPFLFSLRVLLLYSILPSSTHLIDRCPVCIKKCQDWGP